MGCAQLEATGGVMEEWRQVVGFEDIYAVSEYGTVRRLHSGRVLRPLVNDKGRSYYHLSDRGRVEKRMAHHLVLEAFVGPGNGLWALHADDDPTNNHISNLRWGTPAENAADRKRNNPFWDNGRQARTSCTNGHEFTPENTHMQLQRATGRVNRRCRECMRQQSNAASRKRRAN